MKTEREREREVKFRENGRLGWGKKELYFLIKPF